MLEITIVDASTLALRGRLDAAHAERCSRAIDALEGSPTLDLAELRYIASAGISVLVEAHKKVQPRGQVIRLLNLQPQVSMVLRFSQLQDVFVIE